MKSEDFLHQLSQDTIRQHQAQKQLLSFEAFLNQTWEVPYLPIRNANLYILDALNWAQGQSPPLSLSSVFESSPHPWRGQCVFGQAEVLQKLVHAIESAFRENVPHRLILLHGPNGSGKTSIIQKLMLVLEAYAQNPEGALYAFNWIFPTKDISGSHLGLKSTTQQKELLSYAHLPADQIACIIRSEIHESPLFLIPKTHRHHLWEKWMATTDQNFPQYSSRLNSLQKYFFEGALSLRNQSIFEALLQSYEGNIQKVYRHVQVERFYLNPVTLTGLVSIHPLGSVDAGIRQISIDSYTQSLPPVLQSINLYELQGELILGNRGLIEFNDLLKRPIDSFKYLLHTCETGQVVVGPMTLQLDSVLMGTCNEKQIEAFKEYPDFSSFKARFDLIPVPFLLNYQEEAKIYRILLAQLESTKPFTPHCAILIALWAVMTRLKKPTLENIPESLHPRVAELSCLEKAYLYAGEFEKLSITSLEPEKLDELRKTFQQQHSHSTHYEGSQGASPRELKNLLLCALKRASAQRCVTFQTLLLELEELVQRVSEFEFLRQKNTLEDYTASPPMLNSLIQKLAIDYADIDFRTALGLYDEAKIDEYLNKYLFHLSHLLKREKIRDSKTGQLQSPDIALIESFESRVRATDATAFREKIMSTIASAHLNKPMTKSNWARLFPQIRTQLTQSFYAQQHPEMAAALSYLLKQSTSGLSPALKKSADTAKHIFQSKFKYQHECFEEALGWLLKQYDQPKSVNN